MGSPRQLAVSVAAEARGSGRREHRSTPSTAVVRALREAPEIDVALAGAAFVSLLLAPSIRGDGTIDLIAVLLAAGTSAPLLVRRRFPVPVLVLVIAGLLACLAVFHPADAAVGVAMLAVYTVGELGTRTQSLIVGAAMAPAVATAVLLTGDSGFEVGPTVARLAAILAALAVGDARRGRRALAEQTKADAAREREADSLHRFDEERLRLAHELHDTVGHALVGINARAAAAVHVNGTSSDTAAALADIARSSAEALAELRSTIRLVRPAGDAAPTRPRQGLGDLPDLVDGVRGAGLEVALRVDPLPSELPPATEHAAYRIIQESLTNVLRHSTSAHARAVVSVRGTTLHVEIADDGAPPTPGPHTLGQGLLGMAERAAALGGRCEAGVSPTGGWRVLATLPAAAPGDG